MRVAAYVRVSTISQAEAFSLPAQRESITRYCTLRGWTVAEWFEDAGISAYSDDPSARPAFTRLLAEAEARRWDAIVVAKIDRFARSIIVAVSQLKRLLATGCTLIDVSSDLNYATTTGQFMFGMQSLIAENESRQISDRSRAGIAAKRAAGGYHGALPFGAQFGPTGALTLDPARADDLRTLLTLAAGASDETVAAALTAQGIPTRHGAAWWEPTSVRSVVRRGGWLLSEPEPWPSLWLAARQRPILPRVLAPTTIRLLTGLLRCGCGGMLSYAGGRVAADGSRAPSLQCRLLADTTRPLGARCPYRRHRAVFYEELITARFLALQLRPDAGDADQPDLAALRADLAARRRILWLGLEDRALTLAEYEARRRLLDEEEARLPRVGRDRDELANELARAQASWPTLTVLDRNALLRLFVARVVITGYAVAIQWGADVAAWVAETE